MSAHSGDGQRRIALVATDLSTGGGVNRVIRDLAVMFSERFDFHVTVLNGRSSRASTYQFPSCIERIDQPSGSLRAYLKALWSLRRTRPDVVIGSWAQDNILIALAFLFAPTRTILVEHSSWHFHGPIVRLLRRIAYPLAEAVVVLNSSELAFYRRFLGNVWLIPNPVARSMVKASPRRSKAIIAVGHLTPAKNFADAITAMARSGLEDDGWSLTIVGSGPEDANLLALITRLGLRRTTIVPPTNGLDELYARASLLLLTSPSESFSLVLAEAMAAGVVPLAYSADGPRFLLGNFAELLVDIGDVATLAERLRSVAVGDLEPLRHALATSIEQRFAPPAIASQWEELINQLCPERPVTARHTSS